MLTKEVGMNHNLKVRVIFRMTDTFYSFINQFQNCLLFQQYLSQ